MRLLHPGRVERPAPFSFLKRCIRRRHGVLRANSRAAVRQSALLVIKHPCEDIGEPSLRIDVVELGCCDQRVDGRIPAARAASEATAPGSIAAATIRSFSARNQRRRRAPM